MSRFTVIDVETANADLVSICQIGIVTFDGTTAVAAWESLVDPEDDFDPFNVAVHGITEQDVDGAPTFDQLIGEVRQLLEARVVVCHTPFDRLALERASERYEVACPSCTWLDSARVVRRAWPDRYARAGYGLGNVAADLGIAYDAHRAVEDARAAGEVVVQAVAATGLSLDEWLLRVCQPIAVPARDADFDPNPEGPLYGEVICFTGTLQIQRSEAAALAAAAGCVIGDGLTKKTTLLVLGDQDVRKLAGHELSSKHRKANRLIAAGQPIRILSESDFHRIVKARPLQPT
jgi:DNA polymerase-3 subunit epsilon